MIDLPRHHTIRESSHRVINPLSETKLAALGRALFIEPGWTALDLACGKGELLCTWARDHGLQGEGVDISSVFVAAAQARAVELGVDEKVTFVHSDASDWVSQEPVNLAICLGATWIGDGMPGTVRLLEKSLEPNGIMLIGEPYWLKPPPADALEACGAESESTWHYLPDLIEQFHGLGYDVIEMMQADQDSWDRYVAAQWRNIREFLEQNPDDELVPQFREELKQSPIDHTRYQREFLGWGVFALKRSLQ